MSFAGLVISPCTLGRADSFKDDVFCSVLHIKGVGGFFQCQDNMMFFVMPEIVYLCLKRHEIQTSLNFAQSNGNKKSLKTTMCH